MIDKAGGRGESKGGKFQVEWIRQVDKARQYIEEKCKKSKR